MAETLLGTKEMEKLSRAEELLESALMKCTKAQNCGQDVDSLISTHNEIAKQLQSIRSNYFAESDKNRSD